MDKTTRTVLIVAGSIMGTIIIFALVPGLIWGWRGLNFGAVWPNMMGGVFTMFLMPFLWIAVIGLVVWAIVAAVRKSADSGGTSRADGDSALEVLRKRYARGEISKEEFEEKRKDLE